MHLIDSVHTETTRMKEEWENSCNKAQATPPTPSKPAAAAAAVAGVAGVSGGGSSSGKQDMEQQELDSYCFELLSMLLGLSQSEVGCAFLSEQDKLVHDLFTLLHVATVRIQMQARKRRLFGFLAF